MCIFFENVHQLTWFLQKKTPCYISYDKYFYLRLTFITHLKVVVNMQYLSSRNMNKLIKIYYIPTENHLTSRPVFFHLATEIHFFLPIFISVAILSTFSWALSSKGKLYARRNIKEFPYLSYNWKSLNKVVEKSQ